MMELLWNERKLKGPVINTKLQRVKNFDLSGLRSALSKSIQIYQTLNFNEITALASRLIAKRNSSFRSQYGFKLLRKTNIALSRLANINIVNILETFLGSLPEFIISGKIELPTRDNFDFVLIRLQSLAKLFVRIATSAKDGAEFFLKYLHRSYFLETCVFYIGLLAQVWKSAREFCQKTIKIYEQLFPYRNGFGNNKKEWLPSGYELPETLEDFIGFDLDLNLPVNLEDDNWEPQLKRRKFNDPVQEDVVNDGMNGEESDNKNVEEIKRKVGKNKKTNISISRLPVSTISPSSSDRFLNQELDIGVAISRDEPINKFSIETVTKIGDIQKLIENEDELQSTGKSSIPVSSEKWKELRSKINVIIVTSQGRNCVKNFKKMWRINVKGVESVEINKKKNII